jgi:predicted ribosome quality control (RQC) complex YloA/Tae2 family protein
MYNHRGTRYSETRPSQDSYCCPKYCNYPPQCTRHNISVTNLRQLILKTIQDVCGYVRENETLFVEKVRELSEIKQDEQAKMQKKQLAKDKKRYAELDTLFQTIYEDKVNGTLTEKRFAQLSKQYESEQETLESKIVATERELAQFAIESEKTGKFVELVRKYISFEELTTPILLEFVDKVVVHEAERPRGNRNQQIDIYLNFIGKFVVPDIEQPVELSSQKKRKASGRAYYYRNREKILAEKAQQAQNKKQEKLTA